MLYGVFRCLHRPQTTIRSSVTRACVCVQVASVSAFAQTLRRYTSLNHLAQAARAVLQNTTQINQMLADLNRVDFANVQVSGRCPDDDDGVGEFTAGERTVRSVHGPVLTTLAMLASLTVCVCAPVCYRSRRRGCANHRVSPCPPVCYRSRRRGCASHRVSLCVTGTGVVGVPVSPFVLQEQASWLCQSPCPPMCYRSRRRGVCQSHRVLPCLPMCYRSRRRGVCQSHRVSPCPPMCYRSRRRGVCQSHRVSPCPPMCYRSRRRGVCQSHRVSPCLAMCYRSRRRGVCQSLCIIVPARVCYRSRRRGCVSATTRSSTSWSRTSRRRCSSRTRSSSGPTGWRASSTRCCGGTTPAQSSRRRRASSSSSGPSTGERGVPSRRDEARTYGDDVFS